MRCCARARGCARRRCSSPACAPSALNTVATAHRRPAGVRPAVGRDGLRALIEGLAHRRGFGFSIERAVFATVLHRLMVSGSDRACERWLEAYQLDGAETLELHQLYRAMTWLGEELADQSGATRASRRIKDVIEEQLFARRRSLSPTLR